MNVRKKRDPRGRKPGFVSEAQKALAKEMRAKGYVDPEEASEMACVSRSTIYGWIRRGVLRPEKVHGSVWISRVELGPHCPAAIPQAG